jgi:hypothetical protein
LAATLPSRSAIAVGASGAKIPLGVISKASPRSRAAAGQRVVERLPDDPQALSQRSVRPLAQASKSLVGVPAGAKARPCCEQAHVAGTCRRWTAAHSIQITAPPLDPDIPNARTTWGTNGLMVVDVGRGRLPEQRAELAQALINACVEALGLCNRLRGV